MGGLLILVLFGLYVWITYRLIIRSKRWLAKAVVTLVAALIPTADAVYGRIKVRQMCEIDGGLKIFSTADGVDGFQYPGRPETEWLTKYGYRFIEGTARGNVVDRARIEPDGSIFVERNVAPIAQYAFEREGVSLGYGLGYGEYRVTNTKTHAKLGLYKTYAFEGGWVERVVAGLFASKSLAKSCDFDDSWSMTLRLIQGTLKPARL